MSFIEGPARDKASLLPRRVDDYVEPDPVACSKSLIDEGCGERARQSSRPLCDDRFTSIRDIDSTSQLHK